jgi:hypothetical protein
MRHAIAAAAACLAITCSAPAIAAGQGRGWDDVDTLRCESIDRRWRACRVDTRGDVRLVRQLSDTRCVRGRTWGTDARGIWVDGGCRGEFAIVRGRGRGHDGGAAGQRFRCESNDHRANECGVPGRGDVRIVRQLSDVRCVEGRNWGQRGGRVWVDDGCRAEFEVSYRGGRGR